MANIKKLALGLLVAFLAFGFSAFKNVKPAETKFAPFYYINNGTNYTLFSNGTPPNVENNCVPEDENPCAIQSDSPLSLPLASDDWDTTDATQVPESGAGVYE